MKENEDKLHLTFLCLCLQQPLLEGLCFQIIPQFDILGSICESIWLLSIIYFDPTLTLGLKDELIRSWWSKIKINIFLVLVNSYKNGHNFSVNLNIEHYSQLL